VEPANNAETAEPAKVPDHLKNYWMSFPPLPERRLRMTILSEVEGML
jgi:hypothetical protein